MLQSLYEPVLQATYKELGVMEEVFGKLFL